MPLETRKWQERNRPPNLPSSRVAGVTRLRSPGQASNYPAGQVLHLVKTTRVFPLGIPSRRCRFLHHTVGWRVVAQIASHDEDGQALVVIPVRDSVAATDCVRVLYLLKNSGARQEIRNDPRFYYVELWGPDGEAIQADRSRDHPVLGSYSDLVLQRHGFVGRTIDLQCYTLGFESVDHGFVFFGLTP